MFLSKSKVAPSQPCEVAKPVNKATTAQACDVDRPIDMKNKQRGAASADMLIWATLIIAALVFVVSGVPKIRYALNVSALQSDISTISDATYRWKKMRPNYTGVSINKLCTQNYLSTSICGDTGDALSTNPFGGDWTVAPNANKGLYDITFTVPNDPDRMFDLADTVAPMTRSQCTEADKCTTLTKTADAIKMTF